MLGAHRKDSQAAGKTIPDQASLENMKGCLVYCGERGHPRQPTWTREVELSPEVTNGGWFPGTRSATSINLYHLPYLWALLTYFGFFCLQNGSAEATSQWT